MKAKIKMGIKVEHPSSYIKEEMLARGWSRSDLANRMGHERCARNKLLLDLYFEVGPKRTNLRLDVDTANLLGKAFSVSPHLFLNLQTAWLEAHGITLGGE